MRKLLAVFVMFFAVAIANAQNTTTGDCSPIVTNTKGNVTLNCTITRDEGGNFDVKFIRATLACNSRVEMQDIARGENVRGGPLDSARSLIGSLQSLDDEFVYVDISIWVGYGCGLEEISDQPLPKWGVVYRFLDYLDGFNGNSAAYALGYHFEFPQYSDEISNNITSTLLFTKGDDAFFTARYSKAIVLEGLAKVRVSSVQGFQFIELIPAAPIGGLAKYYSDFKRLIRSKY